MYGQLYTNHSHFNLLYTLPRLNRYNFYGKSQIDIGEVLPKRNIFSLLEQIHNGRVKTGAHNFLKFFKLTNLYFILKTENTTYDLSIL